MAGTNIFDHVIPDASTVEVDPNTTVFTSTNLQDVLEEMDAHVTSPLPAAVNASESQAGIIKIATQAETLVNTNDSFAITPAKLTYWLNQQGNATESQRGVVRIATNTDMATGTDDSKAITVAKLNHYASTVRVASESLTGFARLSTTPEAQAATDDSTVMTPLKTLQSIQTWAAGSDSAATTTARGLIRIATNTEVDDDSNTNLAVTPANLNFRTASGTQRGAFYIPTQSVADARTSNNHAVTPGTLSLFAATATRAGTVKLANTLTSTATDTALSAAQGKVLQDTKIGSTGGSVFGPLRLNNVTSTSNDPLITVGRVASTAMLNMYPVGSLYISSVSTNPGTLFGGTWIAYSQGRVLIGAGTTSDIRGESRTFTAGAVGGEFMHQLTEAEMPSHTHAGWGEGGVFNWRWGLATQYGRNNVGSNATDLDNYLYNSEPKGGNVPHNNMQPFVVVYIWRRTA